MKALIPYFFLLLFNVGLNDDTVRQKVVEDFKTPSRLTILTVADKKSKTGGTFVSDSLARYLQIGELNGLKIKVLSPSSNDQGKKLDLDYSLKLKLLIEELNNDNLYRDDEVILFTESHNFLFLAHPREIMDRFLLTKSSILLSFDTALIPCPVGSCDSQNKFLPIKSTSGAFIGLRWKILKILKNLQAISLNQINYAHGECPSKSQMETYQPVRISHQIYCQFQNQPEVKLDVTSNVFHNLNKTSSKIKLVVASNDGSGGDDGIFLMDEKLKNKILILYGHGVHRGSLDFYANQILNWAPSSSSSSSASSATENERRMDNTMATNHLDELNDERLPTVTVALFIQLVPFLEEFLEKIWNLDYPKYRINLFVYNNAPFHDHVIGNWSTKWSTQYGQIKLINSGEKMAESHARQLALDWTLETRSDFYFSVDSQAHLDNPKTLRGLVEENVGIVAPLLARPKKIWANFDTDFQYSPIGFYDKVQNFVDVVRGHRRGLWNVPFITGAYLIHSTILSDPHRRPDYTVDDPVQNSQKIPPSDLVFCANNRRRGIFMFVNNRQDWGRMIEVDTFRKTLKKNRIHPELFEFFANRWAWEDRYLHPDYAKALSTADPFSAIQPCPDVYSFPALTPRFCEELIEELEHHGNWSGYAVVEEKDPAPTSDIGLDQIEMGFLWYEFLRLYVQPLQLRVYPLYKSKTFSTDVPFVIRYQPDGRKILNPHLDESTYTINIALNTAGKDYEGGGVRFTRYNCSVLENKPGWLLMHPGELSHQHHGLVVTKGRRYVLISFVDPPLLLGTWEGKEKL